VVTGRKKKADNEREIGGKTLDQWDDEWEELEGGFSTVHSSVLNVIGIFRADLDGEPKVLGSATDFDRGGLYKRLQTLGSDIVQTGNNHVSGAYIRANKNALRLYVIKVDTGAGSDLITKEICNLMRKRYGIKKGTIGKSGM
jgi:hypothetical protein